MAALRFVLASASPARLRTLQSAGLTPEVLVSGVDEEPVRAPSVPELVAALARLKAEAVAADLHPADGETLVVLGCDSLLERAGQPLGKPGSAAAAVARWRQMSGASGRLHTGHHLIVNRNGSMRAETAVATTTVHFAELSEAEITAYVATGEPLQVAGAFTADTVDSIEGDHHVVVVSLDALDGIGGPFVHSIEGDHHNVVGVSLPLLRRMLGGLGIAWTDLWSPQTATDHDAGLRPGGAGRQRPGRHR